MSEDLETARRYRLHAEELRTIAAEANPELRSSLVGIAADYDRMASTLEAIDTANARLRARL